jgi:hypothetical protein
MDWRFSPNTKSSCLQLCNDAIRDNFRQKEFKVDREWNCKVLSIVGCNDVRNRMPVSIRGGGGELDNYKP